MMILFYRAAITSSYPLCRRSAHSRRTIRTLWRAL